MTIFLDMHQAPKNTYWPTAQSSEAGIRSGWSEYIVVMVQSPEPTLKHDPL
jgi:hypothetical protein